MIETLCDDVLSKKNSRKPAAMAILTARMAINGASVWTLWRSFSRSHRFMLG